MSKNLIETFELKDFDLEHSRIIGIDPGAGDWSAASLELFLGNKELKNLFVDNTRTKCKDFSVLLYREADQKWIIGKEAAASAYDQENRSHFYENYKKQPSSEEAKECYGNNLDNPSYQELMQRSFQCIIQRIFEINPELKEKKPIFFVGRPSSSDWQQSELIYRDMLLKDLHIPGVKKEDIQIAVVSEAQAALASEFYSGEDSHQLDTNQLTIVIDVGSSTLDAILIKKGESKLGEYSRQIGAGMIEANMLELTFYDDCEPNHIQDHMKTYFSNDPTYKTVVNLKAELRKTFQTQSYIEAEPSSPFRFSDIPICYEKLLDKNPAHIRFDMRERKEKYFGDDGKNGYHTDFFRVSFENSGHCYFDIDDSFMHKAIYEMPIYVPCTEHDDCDTSALSYKKSTIYRSYYDAVSHFLDGVKHMVQDYGIGPTQIITTGGAAVMPFISQLIKEKFGEQTQVTKSHNPSYTVSHGLAYIGYTEIKKHQELEAIHHLIDKTLNHHIEKLCNAKKHNLAKWVMNNRLKTISDWGYSHGAKSLNEAILEGHYTIHSTELDDLSLLNRWWDEISHVIKKEIASRFHELFPHASANAYSFQIHPNIVENVYHHGTLHISFNTWKTFGIWHGLLLNRDKKDYPTKKRQKYAQIAQAHRTDAENEICTQKAVTEAVTAQTQEIIENFKRELSQDIANYVEGLTPYLLIPGVNP
jgi:hypothetical protein